jgi:hypothetical protein
VDETGGAFIFGNTAPFTRVPGSAVNREDAPFVSDSVLAGRVWKETATEYQAEYRFQDGGTGTVEYTIDGQQTPFEIAWSAFHDDGIDGDVLVVFTSGPNTFAAYAFEQAGSDTVLVKEITGVEMGAHGPAAVWGSSAVFTGSPLAP